MLISSTWLLIKQYVALVMSLSELKLSIQLIHFRNALFSTFGVFVFLCSVTARWWDSVFNVLWSSKAGQKLLLASGHPCGFLSFGVVGESLNLSNWADVFILFCSSQTTCFPPEPLVFWHGWALVFWWTNDWINGAISRLWGIKQTGCCVSSRTSVQWRNCACSRAFQFRG